ncbi:hypothetical protein ACFLQL_02235 [Verrucomicrobiota bacterium]
MREKKLYTADFDLKNIAEVLNIRKGGASNGQSKVDQPRIGDCSRTPA